MNGALLQLTWSNSFEGFGDLTPQETAEYFRTMFERYSEDYAVFTGTIFAHACGSAPVGSLACDGASHLRVDYPDLYAVLASTYHTDADHFVTPDLRGRVIVGVGTGAGLTARALNDDGGEEAHQLNVAELASHNHVWYDHNFIPDAAGPGLLYTAFGNSSQYTTDTGGNEAHNNMQPFCALNYAIWAI